jgi:electron transport complex protein RnfG
MNESVKIVLSLVLFSLVATFLLSVSYALTKPLIDLAREKNLQGELQKVFPDSDSYNKVNDSFEVYSAGRLVGYASTTTARGYSSAIEILVGVGLDGKVQGIAILSQAETPGLGTRITQESFLRQFVGKQKDEISLRKFGGQIDGITGATVSSKAVTNAVKIKVEELHE